jgi:DNA-directed RNA polymerase subunit F
MAINEMKPLSLVEVEELVETTEEKEEKKEISSFLKKFAKMKPEKARELRKELENLGILKMKPEHISKVIDLLPEDVSDINKIFVDVSLDENEINKILEIIKKYR